MTTPLIFIFCVHVDEPLICPIHANIEEIMVVLTSAVSSVISKYYSRALFLDNTPLKLPYLLGHTFIARGLTLVTPSLRG